MNFYICNLSLYGRFEKAMYPKWTKVNTFIHHPYNMNIMRHEVRMTKVIERAATNGESAENEMVRNRLRLQNIVCVCVRAREWGGTNLQVTHTHISHMHYGIHITMVIVCSVFFFSLLFFHVMNEYFFLFFFFALEWMNGGSECNKHILPSRWGEWGHFRLRIGWITIVISDQVAMVRFPGCCASDFFLISTSFTMMHKCIAQNNRVVCVIVAVRSTYPKVLWKLPYQHQQHKHCYYIIEHVMYRAAVRALSRAKKQLRNGYVYPFSVGFCREMCIFCII